MPNIHDITTAAYRLLAGDTVLGTLAAVHKGRKRPARAMNPSVTVEARRLERGEGEGMWMCDVVVTAYADLTIARTPDYEALDAVTSRVRTLLGDAEPDIPGGKAFPLIEGESGPAGWDTDHEDETVQEMTYGLLFVSF